MLQPIRPQDAGLIYQRQVAPAEGAPGADAPRRARGEDTADGRRSDRVMLSGEARSLTRAHQAVVATDDVRTDHVEALRARVEAGTYEVDAEAVARRLGALLTDVEADA